VEANQAKAVLRLGTEQQRLKTFKSAAQKKGDTKCAVGVAEDSLKRIDVMLSDPEQTYPVNEQFARSREFSYDNADDLLIYRKRLEREGLPKLRAKASAAAQDVKVLMMNRATQDAIVAYTASSVEEHSLLLTNLRADVDAGKSVVGQIDSLERKQMDSASAIQCSVEEMQAQQRKVNWHVQAQLDAQAAAHAELAAEVAQKANTAFVEEAIADLRGELHDRGDKQDENLQIVWDGVCVPSCGLVPSARPSPR
jgi:hypothetical protein